MMEARWISVEDRIPVEAKHGYSKHVLIYHSYYGPIIGYRYKGTWETESSFHDEESTEDIQGITHWMPLPEPPGE